MQTRSIHFWLAQATLPLATLAQLGTVLNHIQSNLDNAIEPAKNAADSLLNNAAPNIASLVDEAGQNAASVASNVVNIATSNQENQVDAQLSSYHNHATTLCYWPALAAAGVAAALI
ncbi:hypothetical protein IWW37_003161 [Coemansia sp. RSA 2050]|nr:hypothetical protein IWW37_003161 [Coemansia sp. RSA 2050]